MPYYDALPKHVVSATLDRVQWNNSVLLQRPAPFRRRDHPAARRLIGTKTTSRGVVVHIYQPSGKPEYGPAATEHDGDAVKDSVSRSAAT